MKTSVCFIVILKGIQRMKKNIYVALNVDNCGMYTFNG